MHCTHSCTQLGATVPCIKINRISHHGLFASGPDFDITFGLMHTIEKAAEIWVLAKSTGLPELQTIQDDELRAIARDFKVQLREDFLD